MEEDGIRNRAAEELSEREREIIVLVATGAANKEIAAKLGISANTVKVHLRNIFGKIGAVSRTEAAMWAVQAGIVEGLQGIEEITVPHAKTRRAWGWLVAGILMAVALIAAFGFAMAQISHRNPASMATDSGWSTLAAMEVARKRPALAILDDRIFAIGGETDGLPTASAEMYDPDANGWIRLPDKPTAVADTLAGVIDGRIFIPGGRMKNGAAGWVMEVFDPVRGDWGTAEELPEPRSGYGLAVYNGRLYLFGGTDGVQYSDSVFSYDPREDTWREELRMISARAFSTAVPVADDIIVMGGEGPDGPLSDNDWFDPLRSTWNPGEPLPSSGSRLFALNVGEVIQVINPNQSSPTMLYYAQTGTWVELIGIHTPCRRDAGMIAMGMIVHCLGGSTGAESVADHLAGQLLYLSVIPAVWQ